MNCYAGLVTIKERLGGIPDTNDDTALLQLLNAASRQLDKFCDRHFFTKEEKRYYDGDHKILFVDDILSISTFKLDFNADGTFEEFMATSDYHLYPLNGYPKTQVKIAVAGDYNSFAHGIQSGVEIDGVFGYGNGESAIPYSASGDTVQDASGITADATSITVTDADNFSPGQTIRIQDEQIYILAYDTSTNILTVKRGINGTTGAEHAKDTAIYIYDYPEPIDEACLMQAMRWWKRKDSAFSDMMGGAALGTIVMFKGLDADVKLIVEAYKKIRI